jgi:hypothetical protein
VTWSVGGCLVAHAKSKKAILEIDPMNNALVGETPIEIAEMVRRAVTDSALNTRLRRAGRDTYQRYFHPSAVAATIHDELTQPNAARRPSSAGRSE